MQHHDSLDPLERRGELIDDSYLLGPILGIGGMGVVYAATQCSLGRAVALKLPRPELADDPAVRERFHHEAIAGCRIDHRNVVRVLDFGVVGGMPYLAMERVAGPRLGDLVLRFGALPVAVATDLVGQILSGLADAHASRVIHCDVKCDNILVHTERDGSALPRLIDFGIARLVGAPPPMARSGVPPEAPRIAGTPEYLAPELIRGEEPTFACDVYAAGVLLYELVAGATPFAGVNQVHVMSRQLVEEPPPLSQRAPHHGVSGELDEIVARALAKDPAVRFPDAAAFGAALARAQARLPAKSAPPRGGERPHGSLDERHRAVGAAILQGDADAIVVAYLELSRALLDERRLALAIAELEEGVALLSMPGPPRHRAPLWRLLLTLSALYGGSGEREKAIATASAAREQAAAAGSGVGRERAEQLWRRLARGDRAAGTRPPRPRR